MSTQNNNSVAPNNSKQKLEETARRLRKPIIPGEKLFVPRPTKKNIFLPRMRYYTDEEVDFLATLLPLARLPTRVSPDNEYSLTPPLFVKGWIIPSAEFRSKAAEMGIACYFTDTDKPARQGKGKSKRIYNRVSTFNLYVDVVLETLNIDLPVPSFVRVVIGPELDPEGHAQDVLMLGVYDNYTRQERLPCPETIQKVQDVFGLSGEPLWYPSSCELLWRSSRPW